MNTQEVDEFWLLYNEKQQCYDKELRNVDYAQDLKKIYERSRASSSRGAVSVNSSQANTDYNVVKVDSLVFLMLSEEEQAACGLCINEILDLGNDNESSQKKLFTNDQWSYLNEYLGSKKTKHLPKFSSNTKEKIKEIINQIKCNEEGEAYYVALESVRGAHPNDKWIFRVLVHV
ncbi:hypothetical protein RMATCC62417_12803 [Rhizopus microsporus]|nr:hypothetical protein RMATCC62417_12803 [Rhizopus microsporus]